MDRIGNIPSLGTLSFTLCLYCSRWSVEKVAERGGFAEKGKNWQFWKYAPLPDYAIPWIKNKKVSTALSGLIGTLAIFFIALGIGKLIKNIPPMKMMVFLTISSFIFFPSTFAHAARPLTTEDAYTVEKGAFQLETAFDFARQDNHDKEYAPSMILTYGLFERMDVGIGIGYLFVNQSARIDGLAYRTIQSSKTCSLNSRFCLQIWLRANLGL